MAIRYGRIPVRGELSGPPPFIPSLRFGALTMRVLVVKTSSLGDVIHTLPAVTDAARALPGIRFDWVVEEAFAEIPGWHPAVERAIPVALRRWRRYPFARATREEWRAFRAALAGVRYDCVLDAQGLLKSAWLAGKAHGPLHGLDRRSAREPLASLAYTHRHAIPWGRHAVRRVRELFAAALGYALPPEARDDTDGAASADAAAYGLDRARALAGAPAAASDDGQPRLVCLHGTTWPAKHWPEPYWRELARLASAAGWQVRLPWGNDAERARAARIAAGLDGARVLPRLTLGGLAAELTAATACVAVDTGLGHLAAAFDIPALSLFGPTHPGFTGAWGCRQRRLATDFPCAPCLKKNCPRHAGESPDAGIEPPCFTRLPPPRIWHWVSEAGKTAISPQGGSIAGSPILDS
ncbi:MAG: lipopolysaccharide heptosyltransferase I [Azoarcus sp.]|jgi:heptosyltransferase-1|nr:lipopolysaccharide heptosyltransferase I [Azoarcus sp.]